MISGGGWWEWGNIHSMYLSAYSWPGDEWSRSSVLERVYCSTSAQCPQVGAFRFSLDIPFSFLWNKNSPPSQWRKTEKTCSAVSISDHSIKNWSMFPARRWRRPWPRATWPRSSRWAFNLQFANIFCRTSGVARLHPVYESWCGRLHEDQIPPPPGPDLPCTHVWRTANAHPSVPERGPSTVYQLCCNATLSSLGECL